MSWQKDDYIAYSKNILKDLELINELKFECLKHFDSVDEFLTSIAKFCGVNGGAKKTLTVRLTELYYRHHTLRKDDIVRLKEFLDHLRRKA